MPGLPGLGKTMEAMIAGFNTREKWSSFSNAPEAGMPGGNVLQGRPGVATNARALTRILGGGGAEVAIAKPSIALMAKEIAKEINAQGKTGGKPPVSESFPLARTPAEALKTAEEFRKAGLKNKGGFSNTLGGPPSAGSAEKFAEALAAPTEAAPAQAKVLSGAENMAYAFGEVAGKALPVVGAVVGIGEAAYKAVKGMNDFAKATVEGNAHLARFSGQLAMAEAQRTVGDLKREIHMAQATGGGASMLSTEYNKLAEEFQPVAELLADVKNAIGTGFVELLRLMTFMLKDNPLYKIWKSLQEIAENTSKKGEKVPIERLFEFFKDQAKLNNAPQRNAQAGRRGFPAGRHGGAPMAPQPPGPMQGMPAAAPAAPDDHLNAAQRKFKQDNPELFL